MVFFDRFNDVQALKWPRSEWDHSGGNPMHDYAKASSSFSCHGGSAGLEQGSFPHCPSVHLKVHMGPSRSSHGLSIDLKVHMGPPSEVTQCTRVLFYDGPVGLLQQFGFTHPSPNATHIVLLLHACPTRSSQPCVSPHLHHIFLSHFSTREGPMQL